MREGATGNPMLVFSIEGESDYFTEATITFDLEEDVDDGMITELSQLREITDPLEEQDLLV